MGLSRGRTGINHIFTYRGAKILWRQKKKGSFGVLLRWGIILFGYFNLWG